MLGQALGLEEVKIKKRKCDEKGVVKDPGPAPSVKRGPALGSSFRSYLSF